jgi:hypothetical protein
MAIRDLITIEEHVAGCPSCAAELSELRAVGDALRLAAAPAPADDWKGVQSGVISRMRVEAHESWSARTGRMFDDLHLIWIGLASTLATFLCGMVALSALHFASPEREDSLAAMISSISAPLGSNQNPLRGDPLLQAPSVPTSGTMIEAMLAQPVSHEELTLALSAVITREGRVEGISVIDRELRSEELTRILDALSRGKLDPATLRASPVAVNLVWLLAHTTVRAKAPPRAI